MKNRISKIVIVGGGTAGWLAANILGKKLNTDISNRFSITLIESPDIPTIGVGEGTVPTMRETLKLIDIPEDDFIKECDVSFKQSIKFVDWMKSENTEPHYYHHLFNFPNRPGFDPANFWLNSNRKIPFAELVSLQGFACDLGLSPKSMKHKQYVGHFDYAYHLDARHFANLLKSNATSRFNVKYQSANILDAKISEHGEIQSLKTDRLGDINGDFFVDCSGFSSLLLGKFLDTPFVDKSDVLFVNKAFAVQKPYSSTNSHIASHTIATAKAGGWIWDIGLQSRRGLGYVYSDNHISDDEAFREIKKYANDPNEDLSYRNIPMKVGHRKVFWKGNCVSIGLSSGFVEPLEATALLLIEASCKMLGDVFPTSTESLRGASKIYNETVQYAWDRVIDFIKLHYFLSNRDDNSFWSDNRDFSTVPDSLKEKIERWRFTPPSEYDFPSAYEIFKLENYQYVLYGMEFSPVNTDLKVNKEHLEVFNQMEELARSNKNSILTQLELNRAILDKISKFGLSKI